MPLSRTSTWLPSPDLVLRVKAITRLPNLTSSSRLTAATSPMVCVHSASGLKLKSYTSTALDSEWVMSLAASETESKFSLVGPWYVAASYM